MSGFQAVNSNWAEEEFRIKFKTVFVFHGKCVIIKKMLPLASFI